MLTIISESHRVTETEYTLEFRRIDDPGAGFSFPCNEDGMPELNECNSGSYHYVTEEHPERFYKPSVETRRWSYVEPAVGRCFCGEEFPLVNEYMGACECPKCHQWYNLFGQELNPPRTWPDGEDW